MKMNRTVIVSAVVVSAVAAAGIGAYAHQASNVHAVSAKAISQTAQTASTALSAPPTVEQQDEIFRKYLIKSASSAGMFTEDSYQVPGSKMIAKASIDALHKTISELSTIDCTATIGQSRITLNASMQAENASSYIRLNDISGTLIDANGKPLYLSDVFAKAKGTWYKAGQQDAALQAQLDSGIFIFNTSVIAPGYDADKIADVLIANKTFYATTNAPVNGVYEYIVSANKESYLAALKQAFPNLTSADQIISSLFGKETTLMSTLMLRADGTLVKETPTDANLCKTIFQSYTGISSDSFSDVLLGSSTPKAAGSIKIAPITLSKSADLMAQDIKL